MRQKFPDGQAVAFTAVAALTGLGRTTLYRDPALRASRLKPRMMPSAARFLRGIVDPTESDRLPPPPAWAAPEVPGGAACERCS